ncbi:hypothetical protein J6590_039589 [Homalodisca vitripennis]|nr:hypothetical protein J6590_039589 [Homalodisca vitripennis]
MLNADSFEYIPSACFRTTPAFLHPLRPARTSPTRLLRIFRFVSRSLSDVPAHCDRLGPEHSDLSPLTVTGSARSTPTSLRSLRPARPGALRPFSAYCDRPDQPSPALNEWKTMQRTRPQ